MAFSKIIIINQQFNTIASVFAFWIGFYIFTVIRENMYELQSKIISFSKILQTFRPTENASAAFKVPGREEVFLQKATLNAQIVNLFNCIAHIYSQICKWTVFMRSTLVSNVAPHIKPPTLFFPQQNKCVYLSGLHYIVNIVKLRTKKLEFCWILEIY